MKKWLHLLIAIVVLAILGCAKEAPPPSDGEVAPDFVLNDLSGRPIRLKELRGTVVFLNFWATWCPPCRQEIPSLVRLNAAMSGKPFRMLAVAIDDKGERPVQDFLRETGTRLPALTDPGGRVGKLFGITGVPETFIIDGAGIIRKKVVGPLDWDDPSVVRFLDGVIASR